LFPRSSQQCACSISKEWQAAIMGALNLYLDFINIFVMLLQLFGSRR
jgi:uncharacterized protein